MPLAQSLYDYIVSLAGVYATLGVMSSKFPVKVWCSKHETSTDSFYLYCRVEGENVVGFSEMIEGTVKAVASQYFGTEVVFERCATSGLSDYYAWKITEIAGPNTFLSTDAQQALKDTHLVLQHGLSPQQLDNVFPFHVIFDSSLNILQSGEQCLRLIPTAVASSKVSDIFDIHGFPQSITWKDIQSKITGDNSLIDDDVLIDLRLSTTLYRTPKGQPFGLKGVLAFALANKTLLCFSVIQM